MKSARRGVEGGGQGISGGIRGDLTLEMEIGLRLVKGTKGLGGD